MADEADIRTRLTIQKGPLRYESKPDQFFADVETESELYPGLVTVTTEGVDIDLGRDNFPSRDPGLCHIANFGPNGFVEWGIWDPQTFAFYPFGEILPGECFVVRLSRNIQEQYENTGTGTTTIENRLRMKSHGGSSVVIVASFER